MVKKNMVVIITSTINVGADVPFLRLNNSKERLKQYIDALLFLFEQNKDINYVVGDNSAAECPEIITEYVKKHSIGFEWVTFKGDEGKLKKYGKGYGEVEIIDYVIKHSNFLDKCDSFVKVTGRLKIRNFNTMIKSIKKKSNWFLTYGDGKLEKFDTRLYSMRISTWNECISNIYQDVEYDDNSVETIFVKKLSENGEQISSFRVQPNFIGQSGGYGAIYYTSIMDEILKTCKRYIATIITPLYLEPVILWQGDMVIPDEVWMKVFSQLSNKKVFICGLNTPGYRFFYSARNKCKIIGCSDRRYTGQKIAGQRIKKIETLRKKIADYVVVAAMNDNTISEIEKQLIEMNYSRDKIISLKKLMNEHECAFYLN